jgi:thymidine kinase
MTQLPINPGFLEVYCGPMKSGKSLELMYRVEKLRHMADTKFIFFKPKIDTRATKIKSRFSQLEYDCILVDEQNPQEILDYVTNEKLVVIDEAQFFSRKLIQIINTLLDKNINVVVAGLDLDYKRDPFGIMPELLALANEVHKLTAICEVEGCNEPAIFTQRLKYNPDIIVVGDKEEGYGPCCRKHHFIPLPEKND